MKGIIVDPKPSLIVSAHNEELSDFIVDLLETTQFSAIYISNPENLVSDIEQKQPTTAVVEFSDYSNENLSLIKNIISFYPSIDIICMYKLRRATEKSKEYRVKVMNYGALDFILYPEETGYLEIQLSNSYFRQKAILENQINLDLENSLNSAAKEILSAMDVKNLYSKTVLECFNLTKSNFCTIFTTDNNQAKYSLSWDGKERKENSEHNIKLDKNILNSWKKNKTLILDNKQINSSSLFPISFKIANISSYMNIPLFSQDNKLFGVIELCKTLGEYDQNYHSEIVNLIGEYTKTSYLKLNLNNANEVEEVKEKSNKNKSFYSEKIFKLIKNLRLILFIVKNNKIIYTNKWTQDKLGILDDEVKDLHILNLISKKHRDKFVNFANLEDQTIDSLNGLAVSFINRNEEEIPVELRVSEINFDNEKSYLIVGSEKESVTQDVNDVNNEDQSSPEESLMLVGALRSLRSAVTISDMDRNIIYVNKAHKNTFGYEPEELISNNNSMLYSFEDPSGISERIYDAILTVGWEGERISVRKDGEVFQAYEKISVVKDQEGKPVGIVSIIDEITERKRLEQALRESEERYRTLVETASSAIIAIEETGNIILCNPTAENIFGYNKNEMGEHNFSSLMSARNNEEFETGFTNKDDSHFEIYLGKTSELYAQNKNGEEFPIEITLSSCKIEGKKIYTAIIMDITERKNLQEQLIQSAKLAAAGELIAGVTHEVNNPLAVVMGYSELMLEEPDLDEETKKTVGIIYKESERARKVIQNMLSFARQHTPEKKEVFINQVIEDTLSLAEYDIRKSGIDVTKKFDSNLPLTMGEPNQLQQVFLNIIMNAVHAITDHQSEGTILIETSAFENETEDENGYKKFLKISITDDGPGIPQKTLEKIFDPFYTTKPVGKGTGLGLSVSFGIIIEHEGKIYAESTEGEGTAFNIELPIISANLET